MPGTPSEAIAGCLTDAVRAADLIALVADRVYPEKPEQLTAVRPYLAWWLTGGGGGKTLGGASGLQRYDLRVEAVAATEAQAQAVLGAARDALLLPRSEWQSVNNGIQGVFASEDADQDVLDDGAEVAGQTFSLHFIPQ